MSKLAFPKVVQPGWIGGLPPAPPTISLCQHIIMLGTPEAPPEFCLEETQPGSEHCTAHMDPDQDDWDRHREQRSS